jgi:hypothetical protein
MKKSLLVLCLVLFPAILIAQDTAPAEQPVTPQAECPTSDDLLKTLPALEPSEAPALPKPGLPEDALQACTGQSCGCDEELNLCLAECPSPQGQCGIDCRRDYNRCALCCCAPEHPSCH